MVAACVQFKVFVLELRKSVLSYMYLGSTQQTEEQEFENCFEEQVSVEYLLVCSPHY